MALIKNEDIAKEILTAMHLPADVPELHPGHFSRKLCPRSVFLGFESGLKHDVQRVEGLCDGC
jgi:hypothetical protein